MRALLISLLAFGACTTADKVALEEYAPSSPEADIEEVSLSASENDAFDPERVGTEFPDTTKQVAVWYKWDDADSGKKVGIRWSKNGEVVLEQGETLSKIAGASAYVLKMAAGSKLPIGDYQVELLEDGVSVTKIPFKVGDIAGESLATEAAETEGGGEAEVATTDAGTGNETETETETAPSAEAGAEEAGPQEAVAEESEATEPATETTPVSATAAAAAAGPAPRGTPLAGVPAIETKWPGVTAQITELTRKGNMVSAKVRFTNKGSKQARPSFYYHNTYLLDRNSKKYEVLKDEKGTYLGSLSSGLYNWWGENLDPGTSQNVWMRFPAPIAAGPLTLQIDGLDPFEDVQVR